MILWAMTLAWSIAFATAFCSPYQSQSNGSALENHIDAAFIFARTDLVFADGMRSA
jgi:hypothetical protein